MNEPMAFFILVLLIIIGIVQILMPFYVIAINAKLRRVVEALDRGELAANTAEKRTSVPIQDLTSVQATPAPLDAQADARSQAQIEKALRISYRVPSNYVSSYLTDWLGMVTNIDAAHAAERGGKVLLLKDEGGELHYFRRTESIERIAERKLPS